MTSNNSAVASQARLQQVLAKLKERKFRITPQRLAVLEALVASERHPSVDQVYAQVKARFPTTSLATVYKTVALLKEMNEVLELGFSDVGNRYDALRPYPHPHVICTHCGRILDPELSGLEALTEEMSRKTGFTIVSHRLDFYGVCPDCRKAGEVH
ncbi:MAG: Fur family transcriptional regulator [Desulfosoma sp.]